MTGFSLDHQQLLDQQLLDRQLLASFVHQQHLDWLKSAGNNFFYNSVLRFKDSLKSLVAEGYVHPRHLDKFGGYLERIGELNVPCVTSLGVTLTAPSHYDHQQIFDWLKSAGNNLEILRHIPNSIERRVVDRVKSLVAEGNNFFYNSVLQFEDSLKSRVAEGYVHPRHLDKFGSYLVKTGELTVPCVTGLGVTLTVPSHYDHILSPLYLVSDPRKFHFADRFNPNYKGAADRFWSDSAYKEAIQNTGMSGAGGSKGKDGEPTKDDERTLPWKLRLSAEAVTPKFNVSANLNLEMKSGSGSNSKPPPLPPMPTPLVCKLYDCLLGCKKKFID